ncbi:hypothetical protein [Sphingobium olei]|uniref:Uncharacterized protein n=1 Tax=Sphingobium olei TaxID=420955 RepID=A0ABW3P6I4_9SPHN|nr:hypothetical protein [Sphingobium sp.]
MNQKGIRIILLAGAALAAAATTPGFAWRPFFAQQGGGGGGGAGTAASDAAAAAQLAAAIRAELSQQPGTASAEDLEAIIVFVVNQGDYSDEVIDSALNQVAAGADQRLSTAVENARAALLKKGRRGTGATIGPAIGGFGSFTSPGVAPGGGSNYQQ